MKSMAIPMKLAPSDRRTTIGGMVRSRLNLVVGDEVRMTLWLGEGPTEPFTTKISNDWRVTVPKAIADRTHQWWGLFEITKA